MTPEQYDAAIARIPRLGERSKNAARMVLVEGLTYDEAGSRVGFTKSAAWAAVKRVKIAHMDIVGCPPGWHCVTVCLPGGEASKEVLEIERRARMEAWLLAEPRKARERDQDA